MRNIAVITTLAILGLFSSAHTRTGPVRSPDGQRLAYAVPRGGPRPLMTEVWVMRADGSGGRRIGTFIGEPGEVAFLPGDEGLLYLERGLSYPAFGSHLYGGRSIPLVKDRVWRIRLDGSEVRPWPLSGDPQSLGSPDGQKGSGSGVDGAPPDFPLDSDAEMTLRRLGDALDLCLRGYYAMHQGDARAERSGHEAAIRVFEALLKRPSSARIPEASGLAYIQALRERIGMSEVEGRQVVCQDHLLVLGDLLSRYAEAHGGRLPPSLDDLRSWVEGQIEGHATDAAIRSRDQETLAQVLRCPADPDPERPMRYVYRAEEGAGAPVLTCLCHRGRLLRLVGTPGGYRVETAGLSPGQVDSLSAVADRHLKAGEMDRAISLLVVAAHQRPRDADASLKLGHAALRMKDYALAEKAFKTAAFIGRGRALARAYCGLGMIAMARPKGLLTAVDYFRDALIQDRDYADARYQMAKARYLLWEYDAKADIETVLKLDPHYAEAYLLMGDWHSDLKEDYGRAIPWYAKYIAMRPDDPEGRRKLSVAYLKMKDHGKVLETLSAFVQAHPEAVEVMPIVAQACVKREKLDMALSFFRAYLSRIDPKERMLYEDIRLIASGEEVAEYARASGAEQEAFLRRFWNGRDPDLSTPINERLLEHYRRVWYARQTFSGGREPWDRRGEVYVRFGEPDHRARSLMMNVPQNLAVQRVKERMALDVYGTEAIGETYIGPVFPVRSISLEGRRNAGAPDQRSEYFIGPEANQPSQVGGTNTNMDEAIPKELGDGETKAQSQAERRRSGVLRAEADPRLNRAQRRAFRPQSFLFEGYGPVTVSGAEVSRVAWESWVYTRIGEGIEITFTDESGKGVYDYAPTPMDSEISLDRVAKFARYAPKRVAERAMAVSPDFYAPEYNVAPFHFYFDVADFRGRDGRSALEVYYGVPRAAARYVPAEDVTRLVVERQVALIPTASDTVYRAAGELVYEAPGDQGGEGAFVPDVARLEAPAGTYRLEVRARDRMTGRLGLYRKEIRVEAYGGRRLGVSDLELAWRVSEGQPGDKFSKGELRVIPMPTRSYRRGQNVFIYYEVYNLKPDGEGQTKYQVEYVIGQRERGILSRLVGTFVGKREEVAVGYKGRGFREMEAAYKEIDLKGFEPGRYFLRVVVTDLNSGETATKETLFKVVE